ncbi:unnamed protein product [Oreochromis niloticus]|nr:unnamed protein product [Mustela putorius furo]
MAATLTFLLISSLLQGALCEAFNVTMPQNINVLRGSCVTIPCSFDVESRFKNNLDHTCKAYWSDSLPFTGVNAKLKPTKDMTGDLTKRDCTTTFNNASLLQRSKYYFRLQCNNALKYSFSQAGVNISLIDDPPSPTLIPSTLEVKEGTSVSLMCSAPAPCWSHPPALTWTPNLGQSQETLQENQDKTKVKTSVMSFTASHLHHGNKISCTAVYRKQDGSPDVTAETSLTPDISYSPKNITVSVSPSGPVPENSNVSLTCSSNANPAVRNYTWYRADGDQETLIGTGTSLNIKVSRDIRSFFCNAENEIGVGRSSSIQIDVQYSPKNITVSVSPSGPVPENSNAENKIGFTRSNLTQVKVQWSEIYYGLYSGVVRWVLAGVFFSVSVICAACLCKLRKNVKPKEEDRTYMSLSGRTVSSSEYDVINTAPKILKKPHICGNDFSMKLARILNIIFVEEKVQQEKDSFKLHFFATKMAATLTFLLISSLLQGALCGTFNVKMPQNINVLRGSCVTIPCSFDVENKHEINLDDTCKAYWSDSPSFTSENAKLKPTKDMTGDLTKKDCTTTFNNANLLQRSKYYFRLECDNALKYTFTQAGVDISFIDVPPSLTLTPSTLEVKEGTSVSLTCSAPAPCWSHPPALTWTPNLGQSQETLQGNQDKTKVKTSVMNFTASHLHHGNKISCTAVYRKQDGSPDVTAETSLTPDISNSPKNITVSVSPSGPVPENSNVSLTCSSNANPAVRNYTWYRADGDQETLIGTGTSLNIKVSRDIRSFFCNAENEIGVGRSSSIQIDVQYSPKNMTVSVSPSGPVPENSNVSLTCSSNANPAVRNYTWYRADGDQETLIGTGTSLNIQVSRDRRTFFCKAENEIGVGRSSSIQIDVQYSPKNITVSVSPSGPVPENSNVSLTCSSNANPAVRNYTWYRADGDQETLIGTGTSLNIQVSRDRRTFFCKAENEIGVGRSSSIQIDVQYSPKNITVSVSPSGPVPENSNAENKIGFARSNLTQVKVQWSEIYYGLYSGVVRWVLAGVFFSVSVICAACLCKLRKNVKPKEEDRTYMSLSGRTVSSSEYDVINTAPKSQ